MEALPGSGRGPFACRRVLIAGGAARQRGESRKTLPELRASVRAWCNLQEPRASIVHARTAALHKHTGFTRALHKHCRGRPHGVGPPVSCWATRGFMRSRSRFSGPAAAADRYTTGLLHSMPARDPRTQGAALGQNLVTPWRAVGSKRGFAGLKDGQGRQGSIFQWTSCGWEKACFFRKDCLGCQSKGPLAHALVLALARIKSIRVWVQAPFCHQPGSIISSVVPAWHCICAQPCE